MIFSLCAVGYVIPGLMPAEEENKRLKDGLEHMHRYGVFTVVFMNVEYYDLCRKKRKFRWCDVTAALLHGATTLTCPSSNYEKLMSKMRTECGKPVGEKEVFSLRQTGADTLSIHSPNLEKFGITAHTC